MKNIYIYSLSCPLSKEVRYIGKTNSIKRRLQSHIDYAKSIKTKNRPVSYWIIELLNNNTKPVITVLEQTDNDNWSVKEQFWIKHFKSLGNDLLNITIGGKGKGSGIKYSNELKTIRRNARLGYKTPDSTKENIKKALSKKIYCLEDNIILDSMNDAVLYSGACKTTFHRKLHAGIKINNKTYTWHNEQNK